MEDTYTKQLQQLEEALQKLSHLSEVNAVLFVPTAGHLSNIYQEKRLKETVPFFKPQERGPFHNYYFFEYKLKNRPLIKIRVQTHAIK